MTLQLNSLKEIERNLNTKETANQSGNGLMASSGNGLMAGG